MKLTEEQKKELLLKYINPETDFMKADNGKILVTVEASQRIAEAFNLKIAPNAQFEPMAIANYIIQREQQRLAAAASIARSKEAKEAEERAKMDKIVSCIKEMKEQGKNDFEIAQALDERCSDLSFNEIKKGIAKATEDGILPKDNIVKDNFVILKNREAVTKRFINIHNGVKNPERLVETLSTDMIGYYTKNLLSLGHLRIALMDAGIEDEIIEASVAKFYAKYEPIFIEKYSKMDGPVETLVDDVYGRYIDRDMFDAGVIVAYIEKLGKENVNGDDIAYRLYQKEGDEREVYKIMMIQNISIEKRVEMLKELDLQYPISCLKKTFDILKKAYVLPYDEILKLYMASEKVEEADEDELTVVSGAVSLLTEDGDDFEATNATASGVVNTDSDELETGEVTSGTGVEDEEEYKPRRLRITKKEREVKKIERKKTLAILLMGAGVIPVMVLTWQFKVDPLIAARNCVTALSQLANGSMGLQDFLPKDEQLVGLLAGMGTTFVGFVKYLKNRKKLKEAKEDLDDLRVLAGEEIEPEETSRKKGRR